MQAAEDDNPHLNIVALNREWPVLMRLSIIQSFSLEVEAILNISWVADLSSINLHIVGPVSS